ncbi:RES family NAD+ phosphorylase [Salinisphaera sp. Q1T1-3]|uniref:RES family NAD+ phosphorylase n=1 Tax=Salinisphaera sp. Q1T1-3 TaxID=2321229 RepID=UPI000E71C850|nr:RES family NAD+ phosphorylase [Salinisphaera sp. Q1T1-3]RJS92764.1 RES domain-containing protein [Salinisphaera sp. Q1T1-3]
MPVAAPEQLLVRPLPFTTVHRIVPSRFPPVGIFDTVADPGDLAFIQALESRTNERLADPLGHIELVAPDDIVTGPGSTPVMAAFTHPSVSGSRFSDGSYGVYYAGDSEQVAIDETVHHRERFLRASGEPACEIQMRAYVGTLCKPLHDGLGDVLPAAVRHADDYTLSQRWGAALRRDGAWGLAYPSIRSPGGRCVALFRPPAIGRVHQSTHLRYRFDGQRISGVYAVGDYQPR